MEKQRSYEAENWEQESYNQPEEEAAEEEKEEPVEYPMKWHKFLMVMMIFGALYMIAQGILIHTGDWYDVNGVNTALVYSQFPKLAMLNRIFGTCMIGFGVFEFTVRRRLRKFMANGPRSLKIFYLLVMGSWLIYLLAGLGITGGSITNLRQILSGTVLRGCMMAINVRYYKRREDAFINE